MPADGRTLDPAGQVVNTLLGPAVVVRSAERGPARLRRPALGPGPALPLPDPRATRPRPAAGPGLSWHVRTRSTCGPWPAGADALLGEHDFRAFCRRVPGTAPTTPIIRRVLDARPGGPTGARRSRARRVSAPTPGCSALRHRRPRRSATRWCARWWGPWSRWAGAAGGPPTSTGMLRAATGPSGRDHRPAPRAVPGRPWTTTADAGLPGRRPVEPGRLPGPGPAPSVVRRLGAGAARMHGSACGRHRTGRRLAVRLGRPATQDKELCVRTFSPKARRHHPGLARRRRRGPGARPAGHRGGLRLRGKHKPIFAPHVDTGDHVDRGQRGQGRADLGQGRQEVRLPPQRLPRRAHQEASYGDLLSSGPRRSCARRAGHAAPHPPRPPAARQAQGLRRPRASPPGPAPAAPRRPRRPGPASTRSRASARQSKRQEPRT